MSALKTSSTIPFQIKKCLFIQNFGDSNTISLRDSDGEFHESVFTNNKALTSSENIFIGFSKVQIYNTNFYMEK